MPARRRAAVAVAGAMAFFLVVQLGALALVEPFKAAGYQQVENPQNPANSLFYIAILLVATGGMLLLFRFDRTRVLRLFLILTSGLISGYVFSVLVPPLPIPGAYGQTLLTAGGVGAVILGLFVYPEWWVIDGTGLLVAMGAAALFGISFGILPAILLLGGLAIYDAVSVYGTEHMLTLASGVMELRVPVLIVIPTTWDYSFLEMADEMA
ncbi:MAG: presenilin family intramembrane aspartyl protease PSH, partial [Halodesulfurarchaeum sp.]